MKLNKVGDISIHNDYYSFFGSLRQTKQAGYLSTFGVRKYSLSYRIV